MKYSPRDALLAADVNAFTAWALSIGYAVEPLRHPGEVLRIRLGASMPVVLRYDGGAHLATHGYGTTLVSRWVNHRRAACAEGARR